jgi:DNA polymerase III delta subunit
VPKQPFSEKAVPSFADAPAAILVAGDVEFFVEEAVEKAREALAGADTEVLVFDDDAPAEAISDALLNRSLFSPRRLVQLDITRIVGTSSPGELLDEAIENWEEGKRVKAFRFVRALLTALELSAAGDPAETAEAIARKTRRKEAAELLATILKELPAESVGGAAILKSALRAVIAREANDGTVALLTAIKPPGGVDLVKEIEKRGLVLDANVGKEAESALRRLANAHAKEREVVVEPAAIERLLKRTDAKAAAFASELEKLLEWAGKGGRIRAADVDTNVQDEASEDIYEFFEAVGRREAKDALARLERLFDEGREVSAGDMAVSTDRDWPVKFLGMLTAEVRRMLLIRSRLDEGGGPGGFDARMTYSTFQARLLPRLMEPATPFGRSPFEPAQGGKPVHPFALYRAAQRSARYTAPQLARALARAAEVDVKLKDSAPPLETLTAYVGELIAGN